MVLVPLAERLAIMVGILSKDNLHVHSLLLENVNHFADDGVTLINTMIPWSPTLPLIEMGYQDQGGVFFSLWYNTIGPH